MITISSKSWLVTSVVANIMKRWGQVRAIFGSPLAPRSSLPLNLVFLLLFFPFFVLFFPTLPLSLSPCLSTLSQPLIYGQIRSYNHYVGQAWCRVRVRSLKNMATVTRRWGSRVGGERQNQRELHSSPLSMCDCLDYCIVWFWVILLVMWMFSTGKTPENFSAPLLPSDYYGHGVTWE